MIGLIDMILDLIASTAFNTAVTSTSVASAKGAYQPDAPELLLDYCETNSK